MQLISQYSVQMVHMFTNRKQPQGAVANLSVCSGYQGHQTGISC